MYSDLWMQNPTLHKSTPINITNEVNIEYWRDSENNVVGITINFEISGDIHFELTGDGWRMFVRKVLSVDEEAGLFQFRSFISVPLPHWKLENALKQHCIEYKKIAFFD